MNTIKTIPVALLALLMAACGEKTGKNESSNMANLKADSVQEKISSVDAAVPEMIGGVQVVHVAVADTGYTPSRIRLKQGVPARIIFDQHAESECASHVKIPSMNISETDLPKGKQTAVEFTPGKSGEFTFTCGMEMLEGTILVES